jgi:hypothetical protein
MDFPHQPWGLLKIIGSLFRCPKGHSVSRQMDEAVSRSQMADGRPLFSTMLVAVEETSCLWEIVMM